MAPDYEDLHALALRLITPYDPFNPAATEPLLFVGQLPPDLPVELPLPPDSQIVGSLSDRRQTVTILLDSPLAPDDIYTFYHDQLTVAGWSELVFAPFRGGFSAPGRRPRERRAEVLYCRAASGPVLSVQARTVPDRPTEVRLLLSTDPTHTPCAAQWTPEGTIQLLPDLVAPPTAQLSPQSSGSGGNLAQANATLQTDDDLTTVTVHYTHQLELAGWTCREADQDGPLAWSSWAFGDHAGRGTTVGVLALSILRQSALRWNLGQLNQAPRPQVVQQYALEARVEWSAPG